RQCLRSRLFLRTGPRAAGLRRQLIRSVWYLGPWSQLLFRPTAVSGSATELRSQSTAVSAAAAELRSQSTAVSAAAAELRSQSTAVSAAAAELRSQSAATVQSITVSKDATHVLASDRACRNRWRAMAALWRGATSRRVIFLGAWYARRPQRCAGAGGNGSSGVVRSVGRTFARLGRHSRGAQAIRPPPELDLRREPVRDRRRDRISRAGGQRVGRGIPGLRLQRIRQRNPTLTAARYYC